MFSDKSYVKLAKRPYFYLWMYFGKKVVDKPIKQIDPAITDEIVSKLKTFSNIDEEE